METKIQNPISWQYDEFKQVGKDYGNQAEVDYYDASHADFRDMEAESNEILDTLGMAKHEVLIDIGAGTGTFAIEAARRGARVVAVDISLPMLDRARTKANRARVSRIEFQHAGFLTCDLPGESADAIVTIFSFHHLPDFWKGIALKRMNQLLKSGGKLYIRDVILEESRTIENIDGFIKKQEAVGGDFLREDAELHFRDEYSTYDWVIEGLLSRAGFSIAGKCFEGGVIGTYLCTKN